VHSLPGSRKRFSIPPWPQWKKPFLKQSKCTRMVLLRKRMWISWKYCPRISRAAYRWQKDRSTWWTGYSSFRWCVDWTRPIPPSLTRLMQLVFLMDVDVAEIDSFILNRNIDFQAGSNPGIPDATQLTRSKRSEYLPTLNRILYYYKSFDEIFQTISPPSYFPGWSVYLPILSAAVSELPSQPKQNNLPESAKPIKEIASEKTFGFQYKSTVLFGHYILRPIYYLEERELNYHSAFLPKIHDEIQGRDRIEPRSDQNPVRSISNQAFSAALSGVQRPLVRRNRGNRDFFYAKGSLVKGYRAHLCSFVCTKLNFIN